MKQHITVEQLNELSKEAFKKLYNWSRTKGIGNNAVMFTTNGKPLLSIGQMIEFIKEKSMGDLDLELWINGAGSSVWLGIGRQDTKLGGGESVELCDALWEAVKEVLMTD